MAGVLDSGVQPMAQDPMASQEFPSTDEEKDLIVEQVLSMLHSEEVMAGLKDSFANMKGDQAVDNIATFATSIVLKVVDEIEVQTKRDISPKAELGIVAMSVEELMTIAGQYGLKASPEMVANAVEIASNKYNKAVQKQSGGM